MGLLPGPAELFDLEAFNLEPEAPQFEALILANVHELELLDEQLGTSQAATREAGFSIQDDVIDTQTHLDTAGAELSFQSQPSQAITLDLVEPIDSADNLFNEAIAEFPQEAWEPLTNENLIPEDPNPVDIVTQPGEEDLI